jgi:hypothetical protein
VGVKAVYKTNGDFTPLGCEINDVVSEQIRALYGQYTHVRAHELKTLITDVVAFYGYNAYLDQKG